MTAKKIILALGLVIVLVGLAYVRAIYSNQEKEKAAARQSQTDSTAAIRAAEERGRELARVIDSVRKYYIDSMYAAMSFVPAEGGVVSADSLARQLEEAQGEIAELKRQNDRQMSRTVNSIYAVELASLPADLSDYERNVAVKEIKEKLRKYFGMSNESLQKILKK
jgi:hypothetical protein